MVVVWWWYHHHHSSTLARCTYVILTFVCICQFVVDGG